MTTIANLENFGRREIEIAADLMKAYANNECPDQFYDSGVTVAFNSYSGNVFLTNEDYQVVMMNNDDEMYMFYNLSYHGNEGSAEDLFSEFEDGDISSEDWEQLYSILESEGMEDEAYKVKMAMMKDESSCPECGSDEFNDEEYTIDESVVSFVCQECGHKWLVRVD